MGRVEPEPKGLESLQLDRVEPRALVAPFSYMAGLAGLATFYLAVFILPLLLSALGLGLGLYAFVQKERSLHGLAAAILGGLGLVLGVVALILR